MVWYLLPSIVLCLALAIFQVLRRRSELEALASQLSERQLARNRGSHKARLQFPHVDLSRCFGCGTCIRACPEDGVLELIHGQATVVHGARCVGHGLCAMECPTGAIQLTLGDLENRDDIPVLGDHFEVVDRPGVFLAGEVTGFALIRTAVAHGTAVVDEIFRRTNPKRRAANRSRAEGEPLDLCVIGAGPAGLAASLRAKEHGLNFLTLDQEGLGGTVSKYPRRKLVMTQPIKLPLYGTLRRTSYTKEQLMELWEELTRKFELPIREGAEFRGLSPHPDGGYLVNTTAGDVRTQAVCLCLGRRGTPRKLGVSGEELPKVSYSLIDAESYQQRRILVVGGGDSAIEAALGLSEQPGNAVTLSYRKDNFSRLKARNESRIREAIAAGKIQCLFQSEVREILPDEVRLEVALPTGETRQQTVANDDVFIMAGGIPPFRLLEASGVSFDAARREPPPPLVERGTGLLKALQISFVFASIAMAWVFALQDYYELELFQRPLSGWHHLLKPAGTVGLVCGVLAAALIVANLCYLVRRSLLGRWIPGGLQSWMTAHVGTGLLSLLLVIVHSAMAPRDTVGGHALIALVVVVLTGGIGRYLYSFVPRAANGREMRLDEIDQMVASEAAAWDQQRHQLADRFRDEIQQIASTHRWRKSFWGRLASLLTSERRWKTVLARLQEECREQGLAAEQTERLMILGKRAYRTSLSAAHYEDLRALLASWRYFHRWVALLMVLLAATHIVAAVRYSSLIP